jgi:hypothetical protein
MDPKVEAELEKRGLLLSETEACLNCGKLLREHVHGRCPGSAEPKGSLEPEVCDECGHLLTAHLPGLSGIYDGRCRWVRGFMECKCIGFRCPPEERSSFNPRKLVVPDEVREHWFIKSVYGDAGSGVVHVEAIPKVPFRCALEDEEVAFISDSQQPVRVEVCTFGSKRRT